MVTAGALAIATNGASSTVPIDLNGGTLRGDGTAPITISNPLSLQAASAIGGAVPLNFSATTPTLWDTGSFTLTSSNTGGTTLAGTTEIAGQGLTMNFTNNYNAPVTVNGVIDDTVLVPVTGPGRRLHQGRPWHADPGRRQRNPWRARRQDGQRGHLERHQ